MSVDTLAHAKAELYALFQTGGTPSVTGVTVVYDHEPQKIGGPVALTISTAGCDENFWLIAVRIYVSVAADAKAGWASMDTVLPGVDHATNNGHFGPSRWAVDLSDRGDFLVATCVLEVGRQDYF